MRQLTESMEFSFSQRHSDGDVTIESPRRRYYDSTPEQSTSSNGRDQTKYKARAESGITLLIVATLISFPLKLPDIDPLRGMTPAILPLKGSILRHAQAIGLYPSSTWRETDRRSNLLCLATEQSLSGSSLCRWVWVPRQTTRVIYCVCSVLLYSQHNLGWYFQSYSAPHCILIFFESLSLNGGDNLPPSMVSIRGFITTGGNGGSSI